MKVENLNNLSGIYCIENLSTKKKYIGQSVNVRERYFKHKSELKNNKHSNTYLQNAWNKYGSDDFKFFILEYCSISKLDAREKYYIQTYDTENRDVGYNLKSGGQYGGSILSDEIKKKIGASNKKYYENHPEARVTRHESTKAYWANPEVRALRSGKGASMYGKHHTEEAKKKMSEACTGRKSPKRNPTPVMCIESGIIFEDATTAGKELFLDSGGILKVCQQKRKTCGGFHWKFVNS